MREPDYSDICPRCDHLAADHDRRGCESCACDKSRRWILRYHQPLNRDLIGFCGRCDHGWEYHGKFGCVFGHASDGSEGCTCDLAMKPELEPAPAAARLDPVVASALAYEELGPDAPMVVNEAGGKQSALSWRFDLLEPGPLFELAGILDDGEKKYGEGNWKKISERSHLNHALVHIFARLAGNRQDRHLGHAFCRIMMAMSVAEEAEANHD